MTTITATSPRRTALAAGLLLSAAAATAASADVIQASHAPAYLKNVNVSAPALFDSPFAIVPTATFQWTNHSVGVPGADLPAYFDSFCIEAGAAVPEGVVHDFTPMTPAAAGLSQHQQDSLARLWHGYRAAATTIDTSAAFQLAVWEIVHDDGLDVTAGAFTVNSWGDPRDTAQSWLTAIANDASPAPALEFIVLHSPTVQDQILLVPTPASALLMGAATLLRAGRRRRR